MFGINEVYISCWFFKYQLLVCDCWFLFEYTASSKHAFSYIANKNPYVCEQVFGIGSNSKSFMFFSESNIDSEKEISSTNFRSKVKI